MTYSQARIFPGCRDPQVSQADQDPEASRDYKENPDLPVPRARRVIIALGPLRVKRPKTDKNCEGGVREERGQTL